MWGDQRVWTVEQGPEWPDQSVLLPHLGELPQLTDVGRLLPPGSTEVDDPWRDRTYSKNKDGESLYCVSVAAITVTGRHAGRRGGAPPSPPA
jgi:hypothetical protein